MNRAMALRQHCRLQRQTAMLRRQFDLAAPWLRPI